MIRINIGCGQTPTKGWQNYDNSFSLKLAKIPILPILLGKLRVLSINSFSFVVKTKLNMTMPPRGCLFQICQLMLFIRATCWNILIEMRLILFSRKFVGYFDLVASLKFFSHASRNWLSNISNLRMQMPS